MSEERLTGVDGNLTTYGDPYFSRFIRRAFLASQGFDQKDLDRPVVGIADTSSDYNTCHANMPQMVDAVKRGVLEAGGLPLVFPTISLNEILFHPTTMFYRNLLAMDTEEMIRAQPMDSVVLLGGCDKTVPAQLMAAASANVPAVFCVTGAMRTGDWRGNRVGACTDCRRYYTSFRGGEISEPELEEVQQVLCSTPGTCMVMGSASTIACVTETLGLMLPGGASPTSGSGDRLRNCVASGRTAVELATNPIRPRDILTQPAFENALKVLVALGGSTNAIVHLLAIARRAGVSLTMNDLQKASDAIPLLVDCKPSGSVYMEDFHKSGGLPVLLKALESVLDPEPINIEGRSVRERIKDVEPPGDWQSVIRTLDAPLGNTGSLTTLSGSLAPDGAIIKTSAASPELFEHEGPAVVFDSPEDAAERLDDPGTEITANHIMILRNAGPIAAGMPEAGSLPIPKHLAIQGVKDMVRVSDARMSGTAYGTVVLHCAPEAAAGGPLALVKNGDRIRLSVSERRIDLLVDEAELDKRRTTFERPELPKRGWARLYSKHVLQANEGADLDFMVGTDE
jgi:dihydroxy-acid dehydratase